MVLIHIYTNHLNGDDQEVNKAWKITIFGFLLLVLDLGLTVYYVRNYSNIVSEGNIIASNNQYGYLVFVLNFIYLIFVYVASVIYVKYKTIITKSNSTFGYIKKLYTSDHNSFIFANLSFTFLVASFISRYTAIIDWIVFGFYKEKYFSSKYAIIKSSMIMGRYDVVTGIIAALVAIPLWFHLEHLKSEKELKENVN